MAAHRAAGAILATGYLRGAVATHLRVGNTLRSYTLFGVYVGLFVWGGLWLRDVRLRALLSWEATISFQGYFDSIQAETGKSPDDFRADGMAQGWLDDGTLHPGVKAGTIVGDIKSMFDLGRGHATAIVALLRGKEAGG